ncbi:aldo/keto reductase [Cellulophaga omnivescoria]|uniref:aldo/keto reductase n=1 Tax=Cellulophaga omnivescoria TaxID=1888890 RepID=UPI000987605F|nr:aldo/keto reductase [Cellulophaga omnivescoria]WBU90487.1 aldo/keto reductase [Cellulophaga omnivescoria]WKB82607.1 aldo/keto reductase [Cellulophaga lytica]
MKATQNYSRIIAGTMTWGNWGKNLSTTQIDKLIHHCLSVGITTFDHADIYGGYTNEAMFGKAFVNSGVSREHMQLITKCGIQHVCEARDNKIGHYQYNKDYIVSSVHQSLKNLKTDYIDFLLLHRPSPLMHPLEISEAIYQLKKEGKIIDFGVSNFTPSQIKMIETAVPVVGNQVEFSLTQNNVMYDGTLDDCITNKRMAMAWSSLGSYFKEKNDQTSRIKEALSLLIKKYNATEDQLLLAWVLKHPSMVFPVVGTATPERIAASFKALDIKLELEDWFVLLKASQGHPVP